MDIKPGELFVGIIDLFAILMPGAILSYAAKDFATREIFGKIFPPLQTETQGWVVFIFSSYLLGHFIFMMGSFLDSLLYDALRKKWLDRNEDALYHAASQTKTEVMPAPLVKEEINPQQNQQLSIEENKVKEIINTFKWAKANIVLFHPAAAMEIHRLEADSKFFRSLVIVLCLLFFYLLLQGNSYQLSGQHSYLFFGKRVFFTSSAILLLIMLSVYRYAEQRYKSTETAYTYLLAMHSKQAKGAAENPSKNA